VGANSTYRGNAFYAPGSSVRIVGTQACYDYPEVDGGCVDLGQYSCLVLSGCQLLILSGQTRQCIIGTVCSDVSIILPRVEDGGEI
jgi:hypothetical protein